MGSRQRLDQYLVDHHLQPSRSRARDAVVRGSVRVNGRIARKPGMTVGTQDRIEVADEASRYVSRAALKLKAGLARAGFDACGRTALDLGASTGGFTQVLLEAGAAHVYAVDVGHGQLAGEIADDERVTLIEGLNAREVKQHLFGQDAIDCIVCDVSFISLKLALPPALALAVPGAWGLFLVKPQFEVGRTRVGRNGIVSAETARNCADELAEWLDRQPGWQRVHLSASPIAGGKGNHEFLLGGLKSG